MIYYNPDDNRSNDPGIHITLNVTNNNFYLSKNDPRNIEPTSKPTKKMIHPYIPDLYDYNYPKIEERDSNQSKIVQNAAPNELLDALQILAKFLDQ